MEIEKKCENCAFCNRNVEPPYISNTTNHWVCGFFKSKWVGTKPPDGTCEFFHEPTGITIAEDIGKRGRDMVCAFIFILSTIWGSPVTMDSFLDQDSAFLDAYGKYYESSNKAGD